MNNLLQINIEATFILILIYFIYRALLSKDTNFVFNRFFLIGGTFISYFITIPFFKFFTNSDQIFEGQLLSPVVINAKNYQNQIIETISSESNITIIYLVITGLFALHFTYKLIILAYFFFKSEKKRYSTYIIANLNKDISPFSFFKIIFLNNSGMNKDDKENIITHELIHLKQKHSIDLLIIELICIMQWFNPFVWMYKKAIKENHEFLADSKVINTGIDLFSYQSLLIAQTVGLSGFVLTNSLNYSLTKKRLLMMTKKRSSKLNVLKSILLLCILIPLLGVYSFVPDKYSTNSFLKTSGFNDDSVYYIVDEMPEYPGGDEALQLYIATNIEYPEIAKKLGVTAQVFIAFIIDENGKVTDVSVVRSAAKDMEIEFGTQENPTKYDAALLLDKSAFDVISSLPDWKPGVKKGKKVKVHYQAPIKFNLN